ncbi:MAG: copper resistance protein CopC [Solirubrobacteraceae bacterium]|nr:copper resistance protein CopC [Solirubrobacteraceae bacterium]
MSIRPFVAALATAAALALAAAPSAFAHAEVVKRSPEPGAAVSKKPKSVSIRFSQSLTTGLISVTRDGRQVATTAAGLDPRRRSVLRAAFARPLPAGTYVVSWRALAPDGHRQTGSWSFRVRS